MKRTGNHLKSRKRPLLFGAGTLVFVLGSAIFFSFGTAHSTPFSTHFFSSNESSPDNVLTCRKIYQMGTWSWKRYGGPSNAEMKSDAFAKDFAKHFLDKLDPFHLLWTQTQADQLKNQAAQGWEKAVQHYDCGYFDAFFQKEFVTVKRSLFARLEKLPSLKLKPEAAPASSSSEVEMFGVKFTKFTDWVADEKALSARLLTVVKKIDSTYDKTVARAYQNDRTKFLTDSVQQLLFSENQLGRNLVAKSMLSTLDPYSTYFSNNEFEEFYHELTGGTLGIGVKIRKVPTGLLVEKVTQDSPAERSQKIKPGDILLSIDGKSVANLSFEEAKQRLKGPEKSVVRLDVQNGKSGERFSLSLKRESFTFEEARITYRLLTPKGQRKNSVAVIDIPSFYGRGGMDPVHEERSSAEDLIQIVQKIIRLKNPPSALVLDLRGNPGGYLEEAVAMAGVFLGEKPVVGVVESRLRRTLHDDRKTPLYNGPLVVLQDEETASASEILAGALKDHQRAVVVGSQHSFGKGSVQRLFHLNDELVFEMGANERIPGVVKLTTSIFYSPLGHSPANGGVASDISLPERLVPKLSDAPASDATKSKQVVDAHPFVAESELDSLQKNKAEVQKKIAFLESRSQERMQSLSALKRSASQQAEQELLQTEQLALDEAVAVAADSVTLNGALTQVEVKPTAKAE